jgi:hypothetical protein
MSLAKAKYAEYRQIVDEILEGSKGAEITIAATRTGDRLKIAAAAELSENRAAKTAKGTSSNLNGQAGVNSTGKKVEPKAVLRLALTEESIHYAGGNKLRFHHHVVRALPGGPQGRALKNGMTKIEVELSVAELKRDLERYLSDFAKTDVFPNPLPEIKLETLAVVAFVQDDCDKTVLHAVSVPVETVKP